MPIRAVSFDCFQTLVHTNWDPVEFGLVWLLARVPDANPIDAREDFQRLLAASRSEYVRLHQQGSTEALDAFWIRLYSDWAAGYGWRGDASDLREQLSESLYGPGARCFRVYEDVLPCLEDLRRQGFRLIVLSNWDYTLEQVLEARGLRPWFDEVFASLLVGAEKPDRHLFRMAEERLGIAADQMLHVGDHPVDDYEGALRAGWHALLLDRGCARPTDHSVVSSLLEVPERLVEL
ncbi:MAG: HAD-IA family hydrolase [Fimbriimonadales bacterium]|nr:HAD-IA family hydrolase [Fimbriimonadales bacterium]